MIKVCMGQYMSSREYVGDMLQAMRPIVADNLKVSIEMGVRTASLHGSCLHLLIS